MRTARPPQSSKSAAAEAWRNHVRATESLDVIQSKTDGNRYADSEVRSIAGHPGTDGNVERSPFTEHHRAPEFQQTERLIAARNRLSRYPGLVEVSHIECCAQRGVGTGRQDRPNAQRVGVSRVDFQARFLVREVVRISIRAEEHRRIRSFNCGEESLHGIETTAK